MAAKADKTPEKSKEELPALLKVLADDPRVTVRRGGAPLPEGKCVVYWMQRAQRGFDNPAVDLAVAIANELGLPLVVYFSAISNFPHANLRHYCFLNQGLADIEEDLAERNIAFVVRRPPGNSLEALLGEVGAAMVIGDENPCREPERWRKVLARRLSLPFWTVDADVVVPSSIFSRHFYMLHNMRPKLHAELPRYLHPLENAKAQHRWAKPRGFEHFAVREDVTHGWRDFDRSVKPVDHFTGGTHAALKRLRHFVQHQLAHYDTQRNHPEVDGTSQLSPYLHFGHISPLTIALAVEDAVTAGHATQAARDSYLDELIGWRELSVNFVKHVPGYDSIECAPEWAKKTLEEHSRDRRDPGYALEELERGETCDELWNAGQVQMVKTGWMHNYLRMYWAKKILEWAPNPAIAWEWAVILNDKYELDGRDPNGYSGIAWAIGGVHDRPWFDRPIFGTIRFMSGASTGKKFDSKRYIAQVSALEV
ncbi:deoxyribodipyrimidine photo-lyase [Silvibacterium dinghuense]|uniref:Deoxyribodipyrimidine photo-lyase n=1 Tax=Silvibacterium dinghuense TaxID=1560006 RepID=A0A4Q1SKI1_9BACT|nr:deoxyribodipyrimidine photo-lyase [Silvibacterium dinghuense]RXS97977.1 deoxyribodipyrimidine photolyase [Silvibacterium dinghuense]GGH03518.1 deoxyribodipyrimidine photo-lyase [Silvibacterium dinghuense]